MARGVQNKAKAGLPDLEEKAEPKLRMRSFSNLIFGLTLSIGALTLIGQQPATSQQLLASLAFYAFSFLIITNVWRAYSAIISALPAETSELVNLNILLLFFVSIEPYLFNELFTSQGEVLQSAFIIYALDLASMFLIMALFNNYLANDKSNPLPNSLLRRYEFRRNLEILIAAVFVVSIAPFFGSNLLSLIIEGKGYDIPLRVEVWLLAMLLSLSRRRLEHAVIS